MESIAKPNEISLPNYSETINKIGSQLNLRKKTLLKRTLLLIWPLAIALVMIFFLQQTHLLAKHNLEQNLKLGQYFLLYLVLAIIYYWTLSIIVAIEKRLWIISFFDGKNLDPKESWRIAWKLFFPTLNLALNIFLRYVLAAIVFFPLFIYGLTKLAENPVFVNNDSFLIGSLLFVLIASALYLILLPPHLRYLWFIFLNTYKTDSFSYHNLFVEMKSLNKIQGFRSIFRDMLYGTAGGVGNMLVSEVGQGVQAGLGNLGTAGKMFGGVFRIGVEEGARQATSFGKIIAMYLVYRKVSGAAHGKPPSANEGFYSL